MFSLPSELLIAAAMGRAGVGGSGGSGGEDGKSAELLNPTKAGRSKKRAKKASDSTLAAVPSLEDRLAAFGEAFLDSIDGGAPRGPSRKRAASLDSGKDVQAAASAAASGVGGECGGARAGDNGGQSGGGGRKRKKRRKGSAAPPETASSPITGPKAAPAPVAGPSPQLRAAVAAFRSVEMAGPASSAAGKGAHAGGAGSGIGGSAKLPRGEAAPAEPPARPPGMSAAERRRFMSGKVSEIRTKPQKPKGGYGGKDPEEEREFKKTLREVLDFVTPQLGRREKKQYENAKLRALGGTLDKGMKMPYSMMQRNARRQEAERQEKLQEDKLLGISTSMSSHRTTGGVNKALRQRKEAQKEKKRRHEDRLYDIGLGAREKKGMAVIPQRSLRSYQKKAGK